MAEYRLYCLDAGGRIVRRHDLEADTDSAAIVAARAEENSLDCELWCGSRKIALIPVSGDPILMRQP